MAMNIDRMPSAAAMPSAVYIAASLPQPLLRPPTSLKISPLAIGAGMEAASIGARTGIFSRRQAELGVDVDLVADYAVANALAGCQDFLTREVVAQHLRGADDLRQLTAVVRSAIGADLPGSPDRWRDLAFLAKVLPSGDVLTAPIELAGVRATLTGSIVQGSPGFWVTGYDLAASAIEDSDGGGVRRMPEITAAWTFDFGPRLSGLGVVALPGGWTWDPREPASYVSPDGRTWGHLPLLLAAMRIETKTDPLLTAAARIRRSGMLKVACASCAFGMYIASHPDPGLSDRGIITSRGVLKAEKGTPERPGAWAFPPAGALVQGAGRLLLTLVLHEVRLRGGHPVQVDTDGAFIQATLDGLAGSLP